MTVNHYLYPLNPKSKYRYQFKDEIGNSYPTSLAGFLDCYSKTSEADWSISVLGDEIKKDDLIWVHFASPISEIRAVGRAESPAKEKTDWSPRKSLTIKWDWELTKKLQKHPIPFSAHRQMIPVAVRRANPKTLKILEAWLDKRPSQITPSHTKLSSPVKFCTTEIEVRQGQPEFRLQLLALYDNRCVISGCETRDVLQAAHIKSVSDGGSHDLRNGLILRADLHNLFDRGLITISKSGIVSINSKITEKYYRKYNGKKLSNVVKNANLKALAAHQQRHKEPQ